MSNQNIYPKGITFFAPRQGAPEWVKGTMIVTPNDFFKWLKENESLLTESQYGKQIKFQLTDKGIKVDTWQPSKSMTERHASKVKEQEQETALPF